MRREINRGCVRNPRGFTLVELLVTMSIAIILMALALPLVKYSIEEGRTREASRQFNAFLARAKAQAAYSQRPIGVMIMRDPIDNTRSTQCFLAEIPPPFGGAVLNDKVTINGTSLTFDSQAMLSTLFPSDAGFGIRFDYKGPVYKGYATSSMGTVSFMLTNGTPTNLNTSGGKYPYQLFRLPQKIGTVGLELPKGTYIALPQSGFGASGTEFSAVATDKVTVMFAPSGALSSVDYTGTADIPSATVHFLVARQRTEATPPLNLTDKSNFWISIGNLTGNIATSETGFDGGTLPTISAANGAVTMAESRYYAIKYDQTGGGGRE